MTMCATASSVPRKPTGQQPKKNSPKPPTPSPASSAPKNHHGQTFNLLRPLPKWTRSISKSRSAGYWPAPNLSWTGVSTPGRCVEDTLSTTDTSSTPRRYPEGVVLSWTLRQILQSWKGSIHDRNTTTAPHHRLDCRCGTGGQCGLMRRTRPRRHKRPPDRYGWCRSDSRSQSTRRSQRGGSALCGDDDTTSSTSRGHERGHPGRRGLKRRRRVLSRPDQTRPTRRNRQPGRLG